MPVDIESEALSFQAPDEEYLAHVLERTPQNIDLPDSQRVVVTGIGAVTPIGLTAEETWQSATAGKSGIDRISDPAFADHRIQIAGEVKGFNPERYLTAKELRRVHRSAQLFLAAATEALVNTGFMNPDQILGRQRLIGIHPYDIGINAGSGVGGENTFRLMQDIYREKGDRRIPPTSVLLTLIDRVASVTGMNRFIKGPICTTTAACASSGYAMGAAYDTIRRGDAIVMLTGGGESSLDPVTFGSFGALRANSTRNDEPQKASRPFDKDADGFVNAEGAAVLVYERLDYAKARRAKIYAEVVAHHNTADAYHDTAPSGEGAIVAMKVALWKAGIEGVDYINAHATSTPIGDPVEVLAIKYVFGEKALSIPVSATKSMTGHMLGATGALEAMFAILAIRDGIIPPTINLDNPIDPEMDFVPHKSRVQTVEYAMNNTFGFGGMNHTDIFRRWED